MLCIVLRYGKQMRDEWTSSALIADSTAEC